MPEITLLKGGQQPTEAAAAGQSIVVVGDSAMTLGFRLAGVKRFHNIGEGDATEVITRLLDDDSVGMIIASEQTVNNLPPRLRRRVDSTVKPVVVAITDLYGRADTTDSLREMIKKAIGFDIVGDS